MHISVSLLLSTPQQLILAYFERLMLKNPQLQQVLADDIKAGAFQKDNLHHDNKENLLASNVLQQDSPLNLEKATTVQKVYRKMLQRFERAYQNKVNAFLEEFVADTFVAPLNEKLYELLYQPKPA